MRAGRAGGDDRMVRPLQSVADRDLARGEIDEAARNEERADAPRAALVQRDRGFLDALQAADAGADQDARGDLVLVRRRLPAGILDRLVGRRHRIDDERIDLAALLRLHPFVGIELAFGLAAERKLAGDLRGEVVDLEIGDAARRRFRPARMLRPSRFDAAAKRRHHAQSGDDDASHWEASGRVRRGPDHLSLR